MQNGRLLVLDDEPVVGRLIQSVAEASGLEARATTDPAEFFLLVERWDPTHIALDLVMPKMDGVEVLLQLALRGCTARIILTSGVGSRVLDAAGRAAREHGLDIAGVLSKPFTAASLGALLAIGPENGPARLARSTSLDAGVRWEATAESLGNAIERDQLVVFYQPKVSCGGGALAGFEALVRWRHPDHGIVPPDRFVPLAESSGLIDALTDRVLEQVLDWYAKNVRNGRAASRVSVSVNLSARTLRDPNFVDRIAARCAETGVKPGNLTFELTETGAMEDPVASLGLLTRLRMKGFQLSIDDFGTGYSSMLQLVRLPFSEIKVDRSFVMTAMQSEESRTVVKSIVDLGHSLDLRATAEGVEDGSTLRFLGEIGCDLAQGFHIARPMDAAEVSAWWHRRRG